MSTAPKSNELALAIAELEAHYWDCRYYWIIYNRQHARRNQRHGTERLAGSGVGFFRRVKQTGAARPSRVKPS